MEPTERQVEEVFLRGYDRDLSRTDLVVEINGTKVRNKNRAENDNRQTNRSPFYINCRSKSAIRNDSLKHLFHSCYPIFRFMFQKSDKSVIEISAA